MNTSEQSATEGQPKGSFLKAFFSVAAAAFGVQSEKNRQRDFTHASPWPYIAGGLLFTAVFITILVVVVKVAVN